MSDPVELKDPAEYAKLPDGTTFKAPDGTVRQKPHKVTDNESYDKVPDGAHFTDPQGQTRIKPTYENIDTGAQGIFDIAVNRKEQQNALEHFYGKGKVKTTPEGDFYVDQGNGKRLRPNQKGLIKSITSGDMPSTGQNLGADAISSAAPMVGAGAGTALFGALGSAVGPWGTAAGAAAGAALGGLAGQAYNDAMLGVMGIYDRSFGEEFGGLGKAANESVEGQMSGHALGKASGAIARGVKNVGPAGAAAARKLLGAGDEDFDTAVNLAKKGLNIPMSSWAKTAAYIGKYIPNWAKQQGYDPIKQGAETYYNVNSRNIMRDLGLLPEEASTRTTAAPSSEKAGQQILAKARGDMAASDAELSRVHDEALRRVGVSTPEETSSSVRELQKTIEDNTKTAQKIIDAGFEDINATRKDMLKAAKIGANPGDLARTMADKIQNVSKAVKARAGILYRAADAASGGKRPNIAPLTDAATDFIKALPEGFAKKYPEDIKRIMALGEKTEDGATLNDPPTFGQLHQIRSFLRHGIDWQDLTPDFRTGSLKKFGSLVNQVLHDEEAAPELKQSAKILDQADAYYARNMNAFHDTKLQNLVDMTEAGLPPNPSVIAKMVMESEGGWTERMSKLRRLVGPKVWGAVQNADLQNIFDVSKTLAPGEINTGKFADAILKRYQSGVLENGYSKDLSAKLFKQAQRIAIHGGKLDFKILPGDDLASAVERMSAAQARINELVAKDPYGALTSEIRKLEGAHAARVAEVKAQRAVDPLNFLADASSTAMASADRILSKPDLLKAAAVRFGPDSAEFNALRQVAAQRMLQRSLGATAKLGDDFGDYTADVQKLLFPNGLDQVVKQLGKEMKVLIPREEDGIGSNLSGAALIINPRGVIQKAVHTKLAGPQFIYRYGLSSALEKASEFLSSPKLILFLAQRTKPLTLEEANSLAKIALQRAKYGGVAGAAIGADMGATPKVKKPAQQVKSESWQDIYNARYGNAQKTSQ